MGDEFGAMFDRVQQERADAARKAQVSADEARSQARRDFDTKAACLIGTVIPTLQDARDSFKSRGLEVVIVSNTGAQNVAMHVDPIVRFNFAKPAGSALDLNVDHRVVYSFSVTHTQGGVQVHRETRNHHQTVNSENVSKRFGVGIADELTRENVTKVIEAAFRDATAK